MHTPVHPYGTVVFCDDIRIEVQNKFSVMGVYLDSMLFPPETIYPNLVPRIAALITWREAWETPITSLRFRLSFSELNAPADSENDLFLAETAALNPNDNSQPLPPDIHPAHAFRQLVLPVILAPWQIPHQGKLRVRALRDNEVWMLGMLRIINAAPTTA
jgi:hypothetical protein